MAHNLKVGDKVTLFFDTRDGLLGDNEEFSLVRQKGFWTERNVEILEVDEDGTSIRLDWNGEPFGWYH